MQITLIHYKTPPDAIFEIIEGFDMQCRKCLDTRNLCGLPYVQKDKYLCITLSQGFKQITVWFLDLKCIKHTCRSSVWLSCEDSLHVDFNT